MRAQVPILLLLSDMMPWAADCERVRSGRVRAFQQRMRGADLDDRGAALRIGTALADGGLHTEQRQVVASKDVFGLAQPFVG